jgi:hypothetical protein
MKSLIFGYLERIASDVFDNYHKEITALIGNQHGGFGRWVWAVSTHPKDIVEII